RSIPFLAHAVGAAVRPPVPVPWSRPLPRGLAPAVPVRSFHPAVTVTREVQTTMPDTADQHDRADGSASSAAEAIAEDAGGRSPALIATAVALPLMVLVGVIVFAVLATRSPAL